MGFESNQGPSGPSRRRLLQGAALGLGAAAVSAFPKPGLAAGTRDIAFTLPWLAQGATAYSYIAKDRGFFEQRGLEVEISRGAGSLAAAQAIGNGQFDYGLVSTGATLVAAAAGVPLAALGTANYDAYMGNLVLEDSPIRTPKDLNGKKLGGVPASAEAPFWPAFAARAGIDLATIDYVQSDPRVLERALVDGQLDASIGIVSTSYAVIEAMGKKTRGILWSEYGLTFYSNNVVTTQDTLAKDPGVAAAVTEALMEGLAYQLKNPEESLDIFMKMVPELELTKGGREFANLSQGFMLASVVRPEATEEGLGYSDMAKIADMTDLVMEYAAKEGAVRPDPERLFTNDYVGKIKLSPEEWTQVRGYTDAFPALLGL